MSKYYGYVSIYLFLCMLPCLSLDLHVSMLVSIFMLDLCFYDPFFMPMLRSMLLCALFHAYAWIYMFGCYAMCYCSPFVLNISLS